MNQRKTEGDAGNGRSGYSGIYRHKEKYSISEMCGFFSVSRSSYYGFVKRMDIPAKDLPLAEKIKECQNSCGKTYGYRRVHIWLERQGIHHNPKTILRVISCLAVLSQAANTSSKLFISTKLPTP